MPSERQILEAYKEKLIEEAEKLVLEEFPKKVIEFNALLENGQFSYDRTPVYGFINGVVKCNEKLAELTDITRPMLRDAVEVVNKVKIWILFLIPRIEDGNNFGVSIQEEALSEVRTVEGEAASFLDQMSRYFVSRARLVTKIAKYPHVEDYRRAILDMDEKQFINIRLVLMEMRNHFATLHDMITKNYEKIKTPRSNNTEHMY
ncbi:unnamed protein product [Enterobius vermicularis]|uniref:Proteasome activator complex subunit 3 n=1 Tax=Enterobius vermicularis TaxID=51028 RepID=A0A0N4VL35_ENTVE|nr:unnamed protein product [Enterobius vermicularis]